MSFSIKSALPIAMVMFVSMWLPFISDSATYTGNIWVTSGPHASEVSVGDEMTFSFEFDTSIPDSDSDPGTGRYWSALTSISVVDANTSFTFQADAGNVTIFNDTANPDDQISIRNSSAGDWGVLGGETITDFELGITGDTSMLVDDALFTDPLSGIQRATIFLATASGWTQYGINGISAVLPTIDVSLEKSTDGVAWSPINPGQHPVSGPEAHFRAVVSPIGSSDQSASTPATVNLSGSGGDVEVSLMSSTDLLEWSEDTPGDHAAADGKFFMVSASEVTTPVLSELVLVEGGTLSTTNGLDGTVVDTFYIGKYEVTWGEWQTVRTWAASNGYDIGSRGDGCADDHPVHSVAWFDVVKWCNAKSEMEGLTPVYSVDGLTFRSGEPDHTTIVQDLSVGGYRLPQEAEWEFAARGGNQTNGYTYAGSNDLDAVGWHSGNSGGAACKIYGHRGTWPVGQKAANELDLYDMTGNVREACFDRDGSARQYRGGSLATIAPFCPVSVRTDNFPDSRSVTDGFRIARNGPIVLNEIRTDQPGNPDDEEYVEIKGPPGASLDGVWFLYIGEHSGIGAFKGSGVIERALDLTGYVIPEDGIFLMCGPSFDLQNLGVDANQVDYVFDGFGNALENSDNVTALLVRDFTEGEILIFDDQLGEAAVDIDDDDDGVPNETLPWSGVIDALSLVETPDSGDKYYGSAFGGVDLPPDGTFVASHAYRASDTREWHPGSYVLFEVDEFGNETGVVPDAKDTPGTTNAPAPPDSL